MIRGLVATVKAAVRIDEEQSLTKILIATCQTYPGLSPSDTLYAEALTAQGADVESVPWQSGFKAFSGADLIVIRSTWDYHRHFQAYRIWLDELVRADLPVANRASLIQWNLDKSYLDELRQAGIAAPEQFIVPPRAQAVRAAIDRAG